MTGATTGRRAARLVTATASTAPTAAHSNSGPTCAATEASKSAIGGQPPTRSAAPTNSAVTGSSMPAASTGSAAERTSSRCAISRAA